MRLFVIFAFVAIALVAGSGGYILGRIDGSAGTPDVDEVRRYAEQGHPEALYTLGTFHRFGAAGVPKDVNKAMTYLALSYKGGMVEAGVVMGRMLISGEAEGDNPQSIRDGVDILRRCVDQGSADAAFVLARHHARRGEAGEAKRFARKALDLNHHAKDFLERVAATGSG